jgi:hypothetical protein
MRFARFSLTLALLVGGLVALGSTPALGQSAGAEVTVTVFDGNVLVISAVTIEPAEASVGGRVRLTAVVTNTGEAQLRNGVVALTLPGEGIGLHGQEAKTFQTLNGGRSKRFRWKLDVEAPGDTTREILVAASATVGRDGPLVEAEQAGVTLTVSATTSALIAYTMVVGSPEGVARTSDVPGDPFTVSTELTNSGSEALLAGEITVYFDSSGLSVMGSATQTLGPLASGESQRVEWQVVAREPGLYVITAGAQALGGESGLLAGVSVPGITLEVVDVHVEGSAE